MRKAICAVLLLLALAVMAGGAVPQANAASGTGANCYFTCDCAGRALKCCVVGGSTFCSPTTEIGCTQSYNC